METHELKILELTLVGGPVIYPPNILQIIKARTSPEPFITDKSGNVLPNNIIIVVMVLLATLEE